MSSIRSAEYQSATCAENPLTTGLNIDCKHCEFLAIPFDGDLPVAISWINRNFVCNDNLSICRNETDDFRVAIKGNRYRIRIQPKALAPHNVDLYTVRAEKSIRTFLTGYDQTRHCQPCFKGTVSRQLNTRTVQSGKLYTMDERSSFPYLYICGVGMGPKTRLHEKNFHLPVEFSPGAREVRQTYNGYTVTVENAVAVPIPELEDGWKGLDRETTRCKNFRFAVAKFGWIDPTPAE